MRRGRGAGGPLTQVLAADLLPGLSDAFDVLVAEQRPRTTTRDGKTVNVHDSTLLARRTA